LDASICPVPPWSASFRHDTAIEQVFGVSRSFMPLLIQILLTLQKLTRARKPQSPRTLKSVMSSTICWIHGQTLRRYPHESEPVTVYIKRQPRSCSGTSFLYHTQIHWCNCANTVLSLCWDCCGSNMGVDLIWPVIIAGSNVFQVADRNRVSDIFEI